MAKRKKARKRVMTKAQIVKSHRIGKKLARKGMSKTKAFKIGTAVARGKVKRRKRSRRSR